MGKGQKSEAISRVMSTRVSPKCDCLGDFLGKFEKHTIYWCNCDSFSCSLPYHTVTCCMRLFDHYIFLFLAWNPHVFWSRPPDLPFLWWFHFHASSHVHIYIYIYRHMADKCIDISIFTYLHIIICTYTSCTFILEYIYIYTHIRVNIPPRIQPRFHRGDRHVAITDPSRFAGDLQIFRRRLLGCHCFGRLWYLKKRVLQNDVSWLPGG